MIGTKFCCCCWLWKGYMCYLGKVRKSSSHRTKCNQSTDFKKLLSRITNIGWTWKSLFWALTVPMWPQSPVLCLFSWMSPYHTIGFASFFRSYNLPMETSASSFLRPASYAMKKENSPIDLHLDATLIWGSQELRGWTSVLMVSGQRSEFWWCGFQSTAWQEKWLQVICTLYDPDNVTVRTTHASLDD